LAVSIIIHTSLIDERSSNNINATNTQDSVYLTVTIINSIARGHPDSSDERRTSPNCHWRSLTKSTNLGWTVSMQASYCHLHTPSSFSMNLLGQKVCLADFFVYMHHAATTEK